MGFSNGGGFVQATPANLEVQGSLIVDPGGGTLGGGSIIIQEVGGQAQIQFDSGAVRETRRATIFAAPDPLDTTRSDFLIQSNTDGDRSLEIAMVPPTVIAGTPTRGTVVLGEIGTGVAFSDGVYANNIVDVGYQTQLLNTNAVAGGNNALTVGAIAGGHLRFSSQEIQAITAGTLATPLILQPAGSSVLVGANGGTGLVVDPTSLQTAVGGVAAGTLGIQRTAGDVTIGTATTGQVDLLNTNGVAGGANGLITGAPAGQHLRYSGQEILSVKAGPATSTLYLNANAAESAFGGVRSVTLREQSTINLALFTPGAAGYVAQQSIAGVFCPASGTMTAWLRFLVFGNTGFLATDFVAGAINIANTTQGTVPFAASDNRCAQVNGTVLNTTTAAITVFTQVTATGLGNPGDSLTVSAQFHQNSNAATRFFNVQKIELGIIPSF